MKRATPRVPRMDRGRNRVRVAVCLVAGVAALSAAAARSAPRQAADSAAKGPAVDPKARELLEKMSAFLGGQERFSVQVDGSTEVVLEDGQRVEFNHASTVRLQRPDKLRSDRRGELSDAQFFYDGKNFTLFGKIARYYATAPAPPTIDQAIDAAREKLGIEAPAADLLYSKPYDILMEDVVSGTYIGVGTVRGVPCHHLAFRGNETDWQIWIENGPRPVPLKFVIISKKVPGTPEYRTETSQWDFTPKFSKTEFTFTPTPDATRIDFLAQLPGRAGKEGSKK